MYVRIFILFKTFWSVAERCWFLKKVGTLLHFHLAWRGETSSIIHQDPYFMSPIGHIGHLGLWSPTTPLCLPWQHQSSHAGGGCWCTWKICRWDGYAAWIWIRCTHEDVSIWRALDGSKPTALCQHRSNELRQISSHSMRLWVHVKTRTK